MKAIELTQKHKDKLLEMCKALFCSDNTPYIENNNINIWNLAEGVEAEYSVSIHWFEFIFTHLLYKLDYKFSKTKSTEKRIDWCLYENHSKFIDGGNGIHPIDYLYDEFKKLKL